MLRSRARASLYARSWEARSSGGDAFGFGVFEVELDFDAVWIGDENLEQAGVRDLAGLEFFAAGAEMIQHVLQAIRAEGDVIDDA